MQDYYKKSYLARLGLDCGVAPDEDTLVKLIDAHLSAVPFENLDILAGKGAPSLDEDALLEKLCGKMRGGYCFELNKALYLLLKELGYEVYSAAARIVYMRTDPRPLSHRLNIVLVDGHKWLCDVGYGGPGPKGALRLDASDVQTVAGEHFAASENDGVYTVSRIDDGKVFNLMIFRDEPVSEPDFNVLNWYFGGCPDSIFTKKPILYLYPEGSFLSLVGNSFTVKENGTVRETRINSSEEFNAVVKEHFLKACPEDSFSFDFSRYL